MFVVENEKIGLRGLELEDAKTLHENMNNANLTEFLDMLRPFSLEEEENFIKSSWKERKEGSGFSFAVVDKKSDKLIGFVNLKEIKRVSKSAEVGAWLSEDYWGKGYGSEATKLILNYAFNTLNLHSVHATTFGFNKRSIKALEKTGFKKQGVFREARFIKGKYVDVIYLDLLKKEWEEENKK